MSEAHAFDCSEAGDGESEVLFIVEACFDVCGVFLEGGWDGELVDVAETCTVVGDADGGSVSGNCRYCVGFGCGLVFCLLRFICWGDRCDCSR